MAEAFAEFFARDEPRLRAALVVAYGPERGREAAAEALAYGWQHWERVGSLANPAGYLYRVGQSKARERKVPTPVLPPTSTIDAAWVEPGLPAALEALSERERQAVVLVEGYACSYREVADLLGVSASTVQSYVERGLAKLRRSLKVHHDA